MVYQKIFWWYIKKKQFLYHHDPIYKISYRWQVQSDTVFNIWTKELYVLNLEKEGKSG